MDKSLKNSFIAPITAAGLYFNDNKKHHNEIFLKQSQNNFTLLGKNHVMFHHQLIFNAIKV